MVNGNECSGVNCDIRLANINMKQSRVKTLSKFIKCSGWELRLWHHKVASQRMKRMSIMFRRASFHVLVTLNAEDFDVGCFPI